MGQKLSVVSGVRSENFTQPGNAVNEIWVGNTEIISRLPFGDNDMEQAGWPENGMPKIPWHNFIIPMKRALNTSANYSCSFDWSNISQVPSDMMACCCQHGCIPNQRIASTIIPTGLLVENPSQLAIAFILVCAAWDCLKSVKRLRRKIVPKYDSNKRYTTRDAKRWAFASGVVTTYFAVVSVLWWYATLALLQAYQVYQTKSWDWLLLVGVVFYSLLCQLLTGGWAILTLLRDWREIQRNTRHRQDEEEFIEIVEDKSSYSPQKQLCASV